MNGMKHGTTTKKSTKDQIHPNFSKSLSADVQHSHVSFHQLFQHPQHPRLSDGIQAAQHLVAGQQHSTARQLGEALGEIPGEWLG